MYRVYTDSSETSGSLFAVDTDGQHEQRLTQGADNVLDGLPDFSLDGEHVVFTRFIGVETAAGFSQLEEIAISAGGVSKPVALTAGQGYDGSVVGGLDEAAVFSPDGRSIAYVHSGGHIKYDQLENFSLMVIDADGSHPREITAFPPYSGDIKGVAWSPDGKQLVFSRLNCDTSSKCAKPAGGLALFTINLDGTGERQLTPWSIGASGLPDWSANGDLIVFRAVTDEESGIGNFFTIHPDGSKLTQVTHFKDTVISTKVGFAPDGRWIVFAKAGDDGIGDIYIIRTDGTNLRQVTDTKQAASSPDWAPAVSQ